MTRVLGTLPGCRHLIPHGRDASHPRRILQSHRSHLRRVRNETLSHSTHPIHLFYPYFIMVYLNDGMVNDFQRRATYVSFRSANGCLPKAFLVYMDDQPSTLDCHPYSPFFNLLLHSLIHSAHAIELNSGYFLGLLQRESSHAMSIQGDLDRHRANELA
ncbi:hypothetical protein BC830DRAFT_649516 [Chytriomyces sp. MP71]|nr:hypothetical protein BC830DRAFT_649516 [Chytriomyces sp. MP71]